MNLLGTLLDYKNLKSNYKYKVADEKPWKLELYRQAAA